MQGQEELLKGIAKQRQGLDGRAPRHFSRKPSRLPSHSCLLVLCPGSALDRLTLDSPVQYGFHNTLVLREALLLQSTPRCPVGLTPSTDHHVHSNHWAQEVTNHEIVPNRRHLHHGDYRVQEINGQHTKTE